ncbi:MAG: hypothetical protein ABSB95_01225 [Dissulfurispiraceae bacterium]
MKNDPVAHITEDGREHRLAEHLIHTAERAGDFAAEFGCAEWGCGMMLRHTHFLNSPS